jgi:hypothetical protein
MPFNMSIQSLAGATLTFVVGLVIGGLGPRGEVRDLQSQIESAEQTDCASTVGSEIASMLSGKPWQADADAQPEASPEPTPAPAPNQEDEVMEITFDPSETDGPPPPTLGMMQEAMDLRRTQAHAALMQDTRADNDQQAQFTSIIDDMNADLALMAADFADIIVEHGEPNRREAMEFAAETLEILLGTEDDILNTFDDDQLASIQDETAHDPLSYVDPNIIAVFEGLN